MKKYIQIKIRKEDLKDIISALRESWVKAHDVFARCRKSKGGYVTKTETCKECGKTTEKIFDLEYSQWILSQKHYVESISYLLNQLNKVKDLK